MLSTALLILLPLAVSADREGDFAHLARQVVGSSAQSQGLFTTAASGAPLTAPTVSNTFISTNPTAIPIASLTPNPPTQTTVPLDTTASPGATPSAISGAPGLPDISQINPANYPPLDLPPPTDTPEVQQWIAEVNASGIPIPDLEVTALGGCPSNPQFAANASGRGWWTCGQITRPSDIITCPDKNTWGSSFDDGPSPYTPTLIQYLDQQNIKTTFFAVGSRVISRPTFLQSQYMGGHQIAVHTWSHHYLTAQDTPTVIAELGWSKKVIKDVLGVTPNVYRPPFGDVDDRIRAIAAAMGLTTVIWTSGTASNEHSFDTNDFNLQAGLVSASVVVQNFQNILANASTLNSGFIVLEHDLFQQTVDLATGYTIPAALAGNFTLKPIVECLHKPLSDAYIETNNNASNPIPTTASGGALVPATTFSAGQATGTSKSGGASRRTEVAGWVVAGVMVFAGSLML